MNKDLAEHYGIVVIPARIGKPQDKAKVEAAVLLVSYNLGTGRGYNVLEAIAAFNKAWGKVIPHKIVGRRVTSPVAEGYYPPFFTEKERLTPLQSKSSRRPGCWFASQL